jgi:hypothetical protein
MFRVRILQTEAEVARDPSCLLDVPAVLKRKVAQAAQLRAALGLPNQHTDVYRWGLLRWLLSHCSLLARDAPSGCCMLGACTCVDVDHVPRSLVLALHHCTQCTTRAIAKTSPALVARAAPAQPSC